MPDTSTARASSQRFEDLIVWRKAHALVLGVYRFTAAFPAEERFGLSSQFRRAAVSVSANIAEGYRKRGRSDKARLLNVAEGSLAECHYYLILSRVGYGNPTSLLQALDEVEKLLMAYSRAIVSRGG